MRSIWFWSLLLIIVPATFADEIVLQESLDGPPVVTCESWIVIDSETGQTLASHNSQEVLRPASVTKIMTSYLVLELASESPEVLDEIVTFSQRADKTGGTTTGIEIGEQISVRELLFGLMLPSGNDASVALAEHFGNRLQLDATKDPYTGFIDVMNLKAKELGMNDTHYENPHGLDKVGHVTTAADLAILARAAMRIPEFRKVVRTTVYKTAVTQQDGAKRVIEWKNTNQLLTYGYLGVKTGWTTMANACLVSCSQRENRELIMIVLKSSCKESRFTDSRNLWRWIWTDIVPNHGFEIRSGF
ncbi:D-alanyl-D-alanine carboxypeptidase family protein [uncultured Rubinisphaera sp.]|uniref:D-alanyl-D-alanine carboxypeptidase family protein n=1 Tax=uncultured Rubinisphaera sp. TaxID=1678686 RepID=UPI0030D6FE17